MILNDQTPNLIPDEYSHIYRRKTRLQLIRISAAVMGIEFCYAAETAFVSPTLLKIGISHAHMTMIWCLSPLVGFFLTPVLGSLSDGCHWQLGRRRPFILALSVGIILGLLLVPNGKQLGIIMGDYYPETLEYLGEPNNDTYILTKQGNSINNFVADHSWSIFFTVIGTILLDFNADACQSPSRAYMLDVTVPDDHAIGLSTFTIMAGLGGSMGYLMGAIDWDSTAVGHTFGGHIHSVFTIILFIFIGCVSITVFSFTEMPLSFLEKRGEKSSTYGTVGSDDLPILHKTDQSQTDDESDYHDQFSYQKQIKNFMKSKIGSWISTSKHGYNKFMDNEKSDEHDMASDNDDYLNVQSRQTSSRKQNDYGTVTSNEIQSSETSFTEPSDDVGRSNVSSSNPDEMRINLPSDALSIDQGVKTDMESIPMKLYLSSIIHLPKSLQILCLTNLFCWMSIVSYSLYFTDFVGEAVFGGNPISPEDSPSRQLYEDGIRFGCLGMAVYSLSCSAYSFAIEKLIRTFKTKPVYVGGQLAYCVGMIILAVSRHKVAVIVMSSTTGIMYATVFTMPYILVAQYHTHKIFDVPGKSTAIRGIGTDVAIVSSMLFLAQFILSACMGVLVNITGSTVTVVVLAAVLSFCGAISATQVKHLNV